MADSINAYSLSDKMNQIKSKIGTNNALDKFVNNKYLAMLQGTGNKDEPNILKMLSDILTSLVGSQDKLKKMLVELMTNNLGSIETKVKQLIKQYSLQLCGCGIETRLSLPLGVINQSESDLVKQIPYVDQYDFYGLFTKDLTDPLQKLQYDNNLNTFIKTKIDAQAPAFTWKNKNNVDVVAFTYIEAEERIKIQSPASSDWGSTGIGLKSFVDLYVDSLTFFPTESTLKQLLDSIFDMKTGDPFEVDFDFLSKLLLSKCNCKPMEDDRSKSTFDLSYDDFRPDKPNDPPLMTNIKFGPVDAPYPLAIIPPQPDLDQTYLNTVSVLSAEDYKKGNRTNRKAAIKKALDNTGKDKNKQDVGINLPLNTKLSFSPNLESDMNLKMILMLPVILTMPLLSPKMSMYFGVLYKRYHIADPSKDLWEDKDEYYIFLEKLIELVIRDLMMFLLKKLYAIIKKEVIALVKRTIIKIMGEKVMGYYNQIQSLVGLYKSLQGQIPPQLPAINFNKCKSILDGIDKLFNIPNVPPGIALPPGISMMGMAKSGLSSTAITQDAVRYMREAGMQISPLPDGSPNPNVLLANSISKALTDNIQNNMNIQISGIGTAAGIPVFIEGGGAAR